MSLRGARSAVIHLGSSGRRTRRTATAGTSPLRLARLTAAAGGLGLVAAVATGGPAAIAESAASPTGLVAVSVPSPVVAGSPSTYTLTVTNPSTSTMTNIVAVGNLPAGMTLKNINNCAKLGGNQSTSFFCSLPNLPAGASESATFSILAATTGTYDVTFTADGGLPIPGSPGALQIVTDTATVTVNVQPGPTDIQVTGSSNNGSPPLGTTFTYTFQVKDNGPLPAGGVTFDDALPSGIQLDASPAVDIGSCAVDPLSLGIHCDIGDLGVGQQSTISLLATPIAPGAFGNTATVGMSGPDVHPTNNSFTVSVQPK